MTDTIKSLGLSAVVYIECIKVAVSPLVKESLVRNLTEVLNTRTQLCNEVNNILTFLTQRHERNNKDSHNQRDIGEEQ